MTDAPATNGASLPDLLARVEAATGADREMDAEIDAALWGGTPAHKLEGRAYATHRQYSGRVFDTLRPRSVCVGDEHRAPEYSASLDAALALCERTLPEVYYGVQQNRWGEGSVNDRSWSAYVNTFSGEQNTDDNFEFTSRNATPALALLAAMLRALIAQGKADTTGQPGQFPGGNLNEI